MLPPTTYLSVKILPDSAPTPETLRDLEKQVQRVFDDAGITADIYSEQIIKPL